MNAEKIITVSLIIFCVGCFGLMVSSCIFRAQDKLNAEKLCHPFVSVGTFNYSGKEYTVCTNKNDGFDVVEILKETSK
jgi:hypothetical protein